MIDDSTIESFESFDHNTLSIYFPLPFRILFLLILGFWLCALNFHYFYIVKIDIGPLIRYTRHTPPAPPLYRDVYHVAAYLSVIFTLGLVAFWKFTAGSVELVEKMELLPVTVALACAALMCWPGATFHRRGRVRFLRMLRRVVIGGMDSDLRFADVLLADVITSYAKVLGDTWILICMAVVTRKLPLTAVRPDRNCGASMGVPLVLAVPSLIRLRQCVTDYVKSRGKVPRSEANVHLWNAGKYASAFPVIWFSAVMRETSTEEVSPWFSRKAMERFWLMAVFINSCYSFYWDVTRDWELSIFSSIHTTITTSALSVTSSSSSFSPSSSSPASSPSSSTALLSAATPSTNITTTSSTTPSSLHGKSSTPVRSPSPTPSIPQPWGLRPNRHYHAPELYYAVIVIDFLLRCTWSLKLSPHLGHLNDLEGGIFLMELLELVRRWMWMFLRVEKEWCARSEARMNIPYMPDEEAYQDQYQTEGGGGLEEYGDGELESPAGERPPMMETSLDHEEMAARRRSYDRIYTN